MARTHTTHWHEEAWDGPTKRKEQLKISGALPSCTIASCVLRVQQPGSTARCGLVALPVLVWLKKETRDPKKCREAFFPEKPEKRRREACSQNKNVMNPRRQKTQPSVEGTTSGREACRHALVLGSVNNVKHHPTPAAAGVAPTKEPSPAQPIQQPGQAP